MTEHDLDLEQFRMLLLERKQELLAIKATAEAASQPVELDQTRVGRLSRMDALQAQAMSIETSQRRKLELQAIESALKRIANGDYGYCMKCDGLINPKRLLSNPAATLCIQCASEAEHH